MVAPDKSGDFLVFNICCLIFDFSEKGYYVLFKMWYAEY
jgi:hypothetical protein